MRTGRVFVGVWALCVVTSAMAETLVDPTRSAMPNAPSTMQSAPAESTAASQVGVGMVVTAKEGVMALVDGRILRVGSRTDAGVVVQIAPDAVFVRSAEGKLSRLPLYPEVNLQASTLATTQASSHASTAGRSDRSKRK